MYVLPDVRGNAPKFVPARSVNFPKDLGRIFENDWRALTKETEVDGTEDQGAFDPKNVE